MKTIKIKGIAVSCLLLFALQTSAQYYRQDRGLMLGVNAGYTYPTGDMGKIVKNGLGANFSAKYLINEVIGIGFETGFHSFKSKIAEEHYSTVQDYKSRLIPALLEATFYFPTWNRTTLPYLGVHFGAYMSYISVSQEKEYPAVKNSRKLFLFSPGVGLHGGCLFELSEYVWLDLKIRADYVPKVEDEYHFSDEDLTARNIGYNKMLNIGANIGLLYKF